MLQVSTTDHLLSLSYVMFLVILVSGLATKSKHIPDHHAEARSIYLLMAAKVPVWLAGLLGLALLPPSYHPAVFGFGLQAVSAVLSSLPASLLDCRSAC